METIIRLLTPATCLACQNSGQELCDGCSVDKLMATNPICYSCKARSNDCRTCDKCRVSSVKPTYLWSVCRFEGFAKKLVYKMKFDSNRQIARRLAELIDDTVPYGEFDCVTYVPTAPKRRRERGFDHAKLIARTFAKKRRLPFFKALARIDNTRQLGASKNARKIQAEKAYRYIGKRNREQVTRNKRERRPRKTSGPSVKILIVDDVLSTGATMEACTKLLRQNGFKQVSGAVFARR